MGLLRKTCYEKGLRSDAIYVRFWESFHFEKKRQTPRVSGRLPRMLKGKKSHLVADEAEYPNETKKCSSGDTKYASDT